MEPKRYIGPQDLIYAQPVSLKPVGRPIAAIPIKGAGSPLSSSSPVGYGPPRPVPYPSSSGPSSSSSSLYGSSGPSYGSSGPSYGSSGPSYGSIAGPTYGSGPSFGGGDIRPIRNRPGPSQYGIGSRPPQVFESEAAESYRPKQPLITSVPSVALPAGGLQQHVHHHYHHSDGGVDGIKAASAAVDSGFNPIGGPLYGGNDGPSALYGQQAGGLNSYGSNFGEYETPGGPLYKKQFNLKPPTTSKYLLIDLYTLNK